MRDSAARNSKIVHFSAEIWNSQVRNKIQGFADKNKRCLLAFDVAMEDTEADKRRLSFKDALLNKYSHDEAEDLCFIQISGSPRHKGKPTGLTPGIKVFPLWTSPSFYQNNTL